MTPQLSIVLKTFTESPQADWASVLESAEAADAAGLDRLVVPDHVAFGEDLTAYGRPELGGRTGGVQPTGPDGSWLEPLTTLAVIAGLTDRIRLGTNVLLAALRRPAVLAKTAATLDVLSRGRLDLGVGVGWQQAEYLAAGLDFSRRGRLLDHTLEVCQALWTQERASYSAPELEFEAIHSMPKPAQPGGVPIWVSGTVTKAVARRLARFGAGWIPWGAAAEDLDRSIERMRKAVSEQGGRSDGFGVVGTLSVVLNSRREMDAVATMRPVRDMKRIGITDFRLRGVPQLEPSAQFATLRELVEAFQLSAASSH